MLAFHNTTVTKPEIIAQLEAHAKADTIVKGQYWEDGKGCAIGCALESIRVIRGYASIDHSSHATAESETNIPQVVWRLADRIHEGLPNDTAKEWPLRFMQAVNPGADLS